MHLVHLGSPAAIAFAQNMLADPQFFGWYMKIVRGQRTLEQNALLWALLKQLEVQLRWPLWSDRNRWQLGSMTDEQWKDFVTAAYRRETGTIARGYDGQGYCIVGTSTRDMDKKEFSELIEFIHAFGAQNNVDFDASLPDDARPRIITPGTHLKGRNDVV